MRPGKGGCGGLPWPAKWGVMQWLRHSTSDASLPRHPVLVTPPALALVLSLVMPRHATFWLALLLLSTVGLSLAQLALLPVWKTAFARRAMPVGLGLAGAMLASLSMPLSVGLLMVMVVRLFTPLALGKYSGGTQYFRDFPVVEVMLMLATVLALARGSGA